MFSIKHHSADSYTVYGAYRYSIIFPKNITTVLSDGRKMSMILKIEDGKGAEPYDIEVLTGDKVYIMNAAGQTIDILG